jgi:hypothetical protein
MFWDVPLKYSDADSRLISNLCHPSRMGPFDRVGTGTGEKPLPIHAIAASSGVTTPRAWSAAGHASSRGSSLDMPIIPAVGIGRTLAKGADHQTATRYPAVRQHRLLTCCRFAVIIPRGRCRCLCISLRGADSGIGGSVLDRPSVLCHTLGGTSSTICHITQWKSQLAASPTTGGALRRMQSPASTLLQFLRLPWRHTILGSRIAPPKVNVGPFSRLTFLCLS